MYAYVYDIITSGLEEHTQAVTSDISKELHLNHTMLVHGPSGTTNMIGRMILGGIDGIMIYESVDYFTPIFDDYGLQIATSVNATGTSSLRPHDSIDLLSSEGHAHYIRAVGKLHWQSPTRPGLNIAIKELALRLIAPTTHNEKRLNHLLSTYEELSNTRTAYILTTLCRHMTKSSSFRYSHMQIGLVVRLHERTPQVSSCKSYTAQHITTQTYSPFSIQAQDNQS